LKDLIFNRKPLAPNEKRRAAKLCDEPFDAQSRGDWTPIELFGAVVEAWDHYLHEFLAAV
jgi:hypothetical protein